MKTTMISLVRGVLVVCAVIMTAGCVKINTTVALKADGSGTWKLVYAMPTHMIRQVQMASELAADLERAGSATLTNRIVKPLDIPMIFDEQAVRARFASLEREGITLSKLQTRSRSGWQYVEMTVAFSRFETLVRQRFFDDCGISFRRTGANVYKVVVSLPAGDEGEQPDLSDPTVDAALTPFMKGLVVMVDLETPGAVRNSNSTRSDVRHATWQWDYDKDPRAVEQLLSDKMIVVFESADVQIEDFDKPATR